MKLSAKISTLVLFLSILFAAVYIGLNQLLLQKYLNDSQSEWVNTLTFAIAEGVSLDVINGNTLHARKQLKHIIQIDKALEYAYITDFDGQLFVHTFEHGFPRYLLEKINQAHDDVHGDIRFTSKNGDIYETDTLLIKGMRAQLHIGINQKEIIKLISQTKKDILLASVFIILFGTGIAMLLGRRISAPMEKLSNWMNTYGEGKNQSELIFKNTDSEVASLVNSFKSMIKARSYLELELKKSNENLEERVKLRTEDYLLAKKEAEQANQAKSIFLSSMSHELRTPLNAILGFSQLLEMNTKNDVSKENIREILDAGNHLLELINEILDLSSIEAGKVQLSINKYNLNELLNKCLSTIMPLADKNSIQIVNEVDPLPKISINVDEMRFKQVLLNILSNAIKYNSENGKVTIDCLSDDEDILHLSITDTGVGFTQDQLRNLFKPFERFGAENSHIEGTGLGLLISKDLIELMGGKLTVESETGKGSRFCIQVPLS